MTNNENKGINWEKWGVIVAVISLLITLFGISFNCNSFTNCTSDYSFFKPIEESSENDNQLADKDNKQQFQQKNEKNGLKIFRF